jgi:pimeloyl-ACP methyl ester carboxylesterase
MVAAIVHGARLLALVVLVLLAASVRAEADTSHCGGLNEPACTVLDVLHSGFVGCQQGLTEVPFPGGLCIQLDSDGFPPFCGGLGERPCRLNEHIPSCKAGLVEHLPTDKCIQYDSDGFPSFCGGNNERACSIIEHIPSCKSGLDEIGGTCIQRDSEGYPPSCGHEGQSGCTIDLQLRFLITSCVPGLIEQPLVGGTCVRPDADGFPSQCGDEFERGCTLIEYVPSCKPGLFESIEPGPNGGLISVCKGPPPYCGRNGQRPCQLDEHVPSCQPGLAELPFEMNVCGKTPRDWGETSADELPRGGPRTVFFIHGGGTALSSTEAPEFIQALRAGAPNVGVIYGVDWNNAGAPGRHLRTIRYDDACQFNQSCVAEWGPEPFDSRTFAISDVAYALGQAIRELPTDSRPITIIGHGIGGIIARQLVYRHYDELRAAGRRIAEVITIGSPNNGLLAGGVSRQGHALQTDTACLKEPFGELEADRTGCQVGRWMAWIHGLPLDGMTWSSGSAGADDHDFPQIRWIAVAGNGRRLEVGPTLDRARAAGDRGADLAAFLEQLQTNDPFDDSDGAVTVRSALDLKADECYPFSRYVNPNGINPAVLFTERAYEFTVGGLPSVQLALSGHCINSSARFDPRVVELGGSDLTAPRHELDFVAHTQLLGNSRVQNFVIAALNLYGDTNGDGVVNDLDMRADAGSDQTIACGAPLTPIQLDGTGTVPNDENMTFTWSGPFGTATGISPTVSLPPGRHVISLTVERGGYQALDMVVVTVADTAPPTLIAAGQTVEATAATATPFALAVEATDACSAVTVQRAPDLSSYPLGATNVTVTATDESGNVATATVTVTVVDTTPPALNVPADVTVIAAGALTSVGIGTATAADIFGATVTHDAPAAFPIGTTVVTWTAEDGNGNRASATQQVHAVYDFVGFEGPIEPGGTYKVNRTLPLQFQLAFADGTPSVAALGTLSVDLAGGADDSVTAMDVSADAPADEGLWFRFTGNHYQFNLDTTGWSLGSYRLSVTLDDGRTYVMPIVLR